MDEPINHRLETRFDQVKLDDQNKSWGKHPKGGVEDNTRKSRKPSVRKITGTELLDLAYRLLEDERKV